jgi:hypothetical protein
MTEQFWVVSHNGTALASGKFTRYRSYDEAVKTASEYARLKVDTEFFVLEAVASVKTAPPPVVVTVIE